MSTAIGGNSVRLGTGIPIAIHMDKKTQNWIAMRVDGNREIGLGHVMRCLALATEAATRGQHVRLFSRSMNDNLRRRIESVGMELHYLTDKGSEPDHRYAHSHWLATSEDADAAETTARLDELAAAHGEPALVAVDHYALGAPWHERLRNVAPVLAIDELSDRQLAPDWLVDQTQGKPPETYSGLVPAYTRCLIGGHYALLREEFSLQLKNTGRQRPGVNTPLRILVTMGGVDQGNASLKVISALRLAAKTMPIAATIVAGVANPNLTSLREEVGQQARTRDLSIDLVFDTHEMAALMANHHLAVGAAGTSSWERCAMGLPTINLILAENQQEICGWLAATGASVNLGWAKSLHPETLAATILQLAQDPEKYTRMVNAAYSVCDGRGCARVLDIVSSQISTLPDS